MNLAVSFDVKCKAGMNACQLRQQNIVGEINEILQRIHVRVVHKMLALTQLTNAHALNPSVDQ